MNYISDWTKKQKTSILTGFLTVLLFLSSLIVIDDASAALPGLNYQKSPVSTPVVESKANPDTAKIESSTKPAIEPSTGPAKSDPESGTVFERLVTKTQSKFGGIFEKINQTISNLPQQLEQASIETDVAIRKQIKNELEDKQDDIENAADKVDDLAEKLKKFNKRLQRAVDQSGAALNSEFQNNLSIAQQSLENAAKALDSLADDTEQAKKITTPEFRNQIKQEVEAVKQALEGANQSIKVLSEKPA